MIKYKSDHPNFIRPILKGWGIFIGSCILVLLFLILVLNKKLSDTSYYVLIILFFIQVVRDLIVDRVYEIRFNQDSKQLDFIYKTWFFIEKHKVLFFSTANIVLTNEKTGIFGNKNSKAIHFLNAKTMLLKVNTDKDGFSKETLDKICQTAEHNLIPILKV